MGAIGGIGVIDMVLRGKDVKVIRRPADPPGGLGLGSRILNRFADLGGEWLELPTGTELAHPPVRE